MTTVVTQQILGAVKRSVVRGSFTVVLVTCVWESGFRWWGEFSLSKRQTARHFDPPVRKDHICKLIGQHIPENTKKATSWCINVWKVWSKPVQLYHASEQAGRLSISTRVDLPDVSGVHGTWRSTEGQNCVFSTRRTSISLRLDRYWTVGWSSWPHADLGRQKGRRYL